MDRRSFQQIIAALPHLSREQLRQLAQTSGSMAQSGLAADIIEAARRPHLCCPECECTVLYRDGRANGLQRFKCRACGRTFNSLTGTPLARLRLKDKWPQYCDTLRDPATTVRRAAEQVGVHRTTAFRWRHRMLTRVKEDLQTPLQGIVEADELHVLESQKGSRTLERPARKRGGKAGKRGISGEQVCVLVARDREGRTHDAVTGMGRLTKKQLDTHLAPALGDAPRETILLVTDSHSAYKSFARHHGITHRTINVSLCEHARGAIHVQNVNSYHSRLRGWLYHFRGVATRYLANYCGWRRAIDAQRLNSSEAFLCAAVGVFRS